MDLLTMRFTGTSPLLMHSDRLANPLDAATKAHKALTIKNKKTDEDHEAIARSEWRSALYWNQEIGPYLPTANLRAVIVDAGKLAKLGAAIQRGTLLLADKEPLHYKGPRDPDTLWSSGLYYDCRSVVFSKKRLMRYRPMFTEWAINVSIMYDPKVVEARQLLACAETGGRLIGLGDYRPNKGGWFGRFDVQQVAPS